MNNYIGNIISFKNSILGEYLKDYDNHWDFLTDLKKLIIKVGKNLDKEKYDEVYPNVWISKSAVVDESAKIIGPCIIDDNAEIRVNAFFRGSAVVGKGCVVGNSSEMKNALLFDGAKIPHFNYVGDSIIGYKSHLGAGAATGNIKSDESSITLGIGNKIYETGKRKVGALIGDFVEVGCNCVLNPGVIIGSNTNIYPLTMVRGEIGKNKIVKSMDNIVERKNMKKEKIYIDFDGTLFDTDAFYKSFLEVCSAFGIDAQKVKVCQNQVFDENNLFNLRKLANFMIKKLSLENDFFDKAIAVFSKDFVYDDVVESLEKLSNYYDLILLTYGDDQYQKDKIGSTDLEKFFSSVVITQHNKSQLDGVDYENSVFIDNNPKELIRFYNVNSKKVIRIRRGSDKYSKIDTGIKEIIEYTDFLELVEKEFMNKK